MNAKSMFKMGFLSMIAAIGLCGVSNGAAADADTRDHGKGETTTAGSDDSKMSESRASQLQVVDSEGNVYLLTPLDKHGKATVEYVVPYTNPTSH